MASARKDGITARVVCARSRDRKRGGRSGFEVVGKRCLGSCSICCRSSLPHKVRVSWHMADIFVTKCSAGDCDFMFVLNRCAVLGFGAAAFGVDDLGGCRAGKLAFGLAGAFAFIDCYVDGCYFDRLADTGSIRVLPVPILVVAPLTSTVSGVVCFAIASVDGVLAVCKSWMARRDEREEPFQFQRLSAAGSTSPPTSNGGEPISV